VVAAALFDGLQEQAGDKPTIVVGKRVDTLGSWRGKPGDEDCVALSEDMLDNRLRE